MNQPSSTADRNWSTLIGKKLPRVDSLEKVTGDAKYAADFNLPGQLWLKILRSPHPHSRIRGINYSRALALDGVMDVVTGKDFNGWRWGWMPKTRDESPLAVDKVRFFGEGVAAVCAVDEETAEEACSLIEVEYEPLPGVFSVEDAMKEGAQLVHEDRPGNVSWEFHMDYGDVEAAFARSDLVREDRFETGRVVTGFLEPPAAVAQWDSSGITIWAAKQSPYFLYRHLSACFNLPLSKIRVIQPFIGGGFGGTKNDSVAGDLCAVLFSKRTGRPVKFVYTMEEVFTTCRRRHNFTIVNKMGMMKDGTLTAVHTRAIADGGACTVVGPLTLYLSGVQGTLPYKLENFKHDAYRIFTNHPASAAMRGHGMTHTRFACELQMDMMARELGLDPLEIRIKNAIVAPHETVNGIMVKSSGMKDAFKVLKDSSAWKERGRKRQATANNVARGFGVSGNAHTGGARQRGHQACAALVRLCEDGTVNYLTGATDCGQGSDTVLVQIIAEELGLGLDDVSIRRVDTSVTPCDPGSYGSRVTLLAGDAAQQAAREVKKQLAAFAARMWNTEEDQIAFNAGLVFVLNKPELSLPFRKLAQSACYSSSGAVIMGRGYSKYSTAELDIDKGFGNPGMNFSFTAQLSEVEVDMETGIVKANEFLIAHDCGRALHPVNVEAQIQGGAVQGLGQALYEQFKMEEGLTLNPNFVDYRMPLATESPNITIVDVPTEDPDGVFGAKEASEGSHVSTPSSVVSAICDATGLWFTSQPVTPEMIVMALKAKREQEKGRSAS